jgi:hypothetical protein
MNSGLPVAGYTPQPSTNIEEVNINKRLEEEVLQRLDDLQRTVVPRVPAGWDQTSPLCDARWLAIARTHIEQGFMAANRAIFRPQRVKL